MMNRSEYGEHPYGARPYPKRGSLMAGAIEDASGLPLSLFVLVLVLEARLLNY